MVKSAKEIWRENNVDGVPSSGQHKPVKADIREWGSAVEIFTSSTGSALVYSTRSALYADLAHAANVMAWVVADSTVAYNGVYQKSGSSGSGSWSRVADLPIEVFVATNAGAGTANAIKATTTYPVSSGKLIILPILAANTSTTVTLALNGGTAYPIKTSIGSNPAVGGIAIGKVILYFDGSTYGLLSDQSVAAVGAELAAHKARNDNPHSVTKTQVGLGNVDNTSDLNKPISTAVQTALNAKVTSGGSIGSGATVPTPDSSDDSTKVANTEWVRDYLASVSSGVVSFNGRSGTVTSQFGDYSAPQIKFGDWTNVSSAATVNLGAQNSRNIVITGSTTITSFGTAGPADNIPYLLRFSSTPLITNGANLICKGAANIQAAVGDMAIVVHDSATVWRMVDYIPANNAPYLSQSDWNAGAVTKRAVISPSELAAVIAARVTGAPDYTSSPTTFALGASHTFAHGRGVKPNHYTASLICTTADNGYAVNTEVLIASAAINSGYGQSISADATNIIVRIIGNGLLALVNAACTGTFAPSPSNWKLIVRVWK